MLKHHLRSTVPALAVAAVSALVMVTCARQAPGSSEVAESAGGRSAVPDPAVTAVQGPSWLHHLGLEVSRTHMGEMGGTSAPPAGDVGVEPTLLEQGEEGERSTPGGMMGSGRGGGMMGGGRGGGMMGGGRGGGMMGSGRMGSGMGGTMGRFYSRLREGGDRALALLGEEFDLTGGDLYRLDCQSCHGPSGEGAPPEIKSLLDPVRGASAVAISARMKKLGRDISEEMADQLAAQGEATIRKRLAEGGEKMPAFEHLRGDEIDGLLAYLKTLADVPGADGAAVRVPQTAARVGEHLVKGTCHICHDATGPGGHMAMMSGAIPSLASFTETSSPGAMAHQVRYGSAPMMRMMGGPSMPALPYLTADEVAAGYFYLAAYPPNP